jgi:hypothetical protein
MLAHTSPHAPSGPDRRRRGVVLVLILAMLGLLAVIGVTFATFSSQTQTNARNYADSFKEPDAQQYLDFGFDQLINDSRNPFSALWGHSLKRDMYGNDAATNGVVSSLPSGFPLRVVANPVLEPSSQLQYWVATNIPWDASSSPEFIGGNYRGWTLRLELWQYSGDFPVSQVLLDANGHPLVPGTFQVVDQLTPATGYQFLLSPEDPDTAHAQTDARPYPRMVTPGMTRGSNQYFHFTLDGRFRHAFNGTGATPSDLNQNGEVDAVEANFRFSGIRLTDTTIQPRPLSPDDNAVANEFGIPMDEDYDALDLENWFLAIRSADGNVVIPSFHRPSVVRLDATTPNSFDDTTTPGTYNDWKDYALPNLNWSALTDLQRAVVMRTLSRFLRPRSVDHPKWVPDPSDTTYKDPIPDTSGSPDPTNAAYNPNYGKIRYDVDNDNDGQTDSVWLDLGYPAFRDPKTGKYYKPLFAFMVEGLNGKLPLNTAGNLHKRKFDGTPELDHASHLGFSPSEVNPKYAFASQLNGTGQVQLQKILQGFFNTSTGVPTAGRWGEEDLLTTGTIFPRAGRTIGTNWPASGYGYSDDNYGASDFLLSRAESESGALPINHSELSDSNDFDLLFRAPIAAPPRAGLLLPSERWRKFVTPLDVTGNGRFLGWRDRPAEMFQLGTISFASMPLATPLVMPSYTEGPLARYAPGFGMGFDNRGRHGFYQYYRPPGVPPSYNAPSDMSPPLTAAKASTALWALTPSAANPNVLNDNTHNLLHGYESWRNPPGQMDARPTVNAAHPLDRQLWAPMPWDNKTDPTTRVPVELPTYTAGIAANPPVVADPPTSYSLYPGTNVYNAGSLERDLADELNLYAPGQSDRPYDATELEWLYRGLTNDADAKDLTSRLASLAPESFGADSGGAGAVSKDEARRIRNLFSTDSWDLNTFAWSNDNLAGSFQNNARHAGVLPVNQLASPSFEYTHDPISGLPITSGFAYGFSGPLAHRGRRINLNAPLPGTPLFDSSGKLVYDPAKDPIEPVRQKWIRDTYQTLKQILPPKSLDTPEELAQLSQFVVNIIDFRDPDDTVTRFVNTDIRVTPPTGLASARLVNNTAATIGLPGPYSPSWKDDSTYLIQYGMEYPAVAINETLAYSYPSAYGTGGRSSRFFLELVNTLTRDGGNLNVQGADNKKIDHGSASDLHLAEWDIVVAVEDGTDDGLARPDPFTGQVPYIATVPSTRKTIPLSHTGDPAAVPPKPPGMLKEDGTPAVIRGVEEDGDIAEFVVGLVPPATNAEYKASNPAPFSTPNAILRDPTNRANPADIDDVFDPAGPISNRDTWCWVYLRRPAVSTLPIQTDPTLPDYNPPVVVDSMRFPFIRSLHVVTPTPPPGTVAAGTQDIWSIQRHQPYRGGQAVPNPRVGTTEIGYGRVKQPDPTLPNYNPYDPTWTAYGFSEQVFFNRGTGSPGPGNERQAVYDPTATPNPLKVTLEIGESIGSRNRKIGATPDTEDWDGLVFHDRDFQSVGELLLVPSCPPGLFTKQFVELPLLGSTTKAVDQPPHIGTSGFPEWDTVASPAMQPIKDAPPSGDEEGETLPDARPHVYPYLSEKFFYSPDGTDTSSGVVGGPTGAGWHKMLEFFEVPTPTLGGIGPVASGENRDWYREDRRPGLINPNLIIDEEVFFGLVDDPRLNQEEILDVTVGPQVVFSVDANYLPADADLATTGIQPGIRPLTVIHDPTSGTTTTRGYYNPITNNRLMKAAFADFLRMRHGNPAAIYTADPSDAANATIWPTLVDQAASNTIFNGRAEAPFRSLSFPDIRYTILRPADPYRPGGTIGTTGLLRRDFDAGQMPRTDPAATSVRLPRIAPRRLIQIPDSTVFLDGGAAPTTGNPNSLMREGTLAGPNYSALVYGPSGAHTQRPTLADPRNYTAPAAPVAAPLPAAGFRSQMFLGGERADDDPATADLSEARDDNREHPAFRAEWLEKMLNLTTVRTHQYAVWVTVGVFEVERPGNPEFITTNPPLAYDRLGPERVDINGKTTRYRMFAIIDRSRATGFNPLNPGDFRDLVLYSNRITN